MLKNNICVFGVLHASSLLDNELGFCLKVARNIPSNKSIETRKDDTEIHDSRIIRGTDVISISCFNMDMTKQQQQQQPLQQQQQQQPVSTRSLKFATDTQISNTVQIKERELKKWTTDECDSQNDNFNLKTPNNENGEWDQFTANAKLFDVKTNYVEDMYTTHLDKSVPGFKNKEKIAKRIADEIMNVHAI